MADKLYTVDEVCEKARLTRRAVYTAVCRGAIPGVVKLGRRLRFRRDEIDRWCGDGSLPSGKGRASA